jgi:hypothetical protein
LSTKARRKTPYFSRLKFLRIDERIRKIAEKKNGDNESDDHTKFLSNDDRNNVAKQREKENTGEIKRRLENIKMI